MLNEIVNYLEISPLLGTAGQPTIEQLQAVRDAGYQVVINLVPAEQANALPGEADAARALGMDYVHIPVIWTHPTRADLDAFFAALDANYGRKVFAHCALNMRVSAFVLLYRVLRQGVPPDDAWAALYRIWQPNETWQAFIEERLNAG